MHVTLRRASHACRDVAASSKDRNDWLSRSTALELLAANIEAVDWPRVAVLGSGEVRHLGLEDRRLLERVARIGGC